MELIQNLFASPVQGSTPASQPKSPLTLTGAPGAGNILQNTAFTNIASTENNAVPEFGNILTSLLENALSTTGIAKNINMVADAQTPSASRPIIEGVIATITPSAQGDISQQDGLKSWTYPVPPLFLTTKSLVTGNAGSLVATQILNAAAVSSEAQAALLASQNKYSLDPSILSSELPADPALNSTSANKSLLHELLDSTANISGLLPVTTITPETPAVPAALPITALPAVPSDTNILSTGAAINAASTGDTVITLPQTETQIKAPLETVAHGSKVDSGPAGSPATATADAPDKAAFHNTPEQPKISSGALNKQNGVLSFDMSDTSATIANLEKTPVTSALPLQSEKQATNDLSPLPAVLNPAHISQNTGAITKKSAPARADNAPPDSLITPRPESHSAEILPPVQGQDINSPAGSKADDNMAQAKPATANTPSPVSSVTPTPAQQNSLTPQTIMPSVSAAIPSDASQPLEQKNETPGRRLPDMTIQSGSLETSPPLTSATAISTANQNAAASQQLPVDGQSFANSMAKTADSLTPPVQNDTPSQVIADIVQNEHGAISLIDKQDPMRTNSQTAIPRAETQSHMTSPPIRDIAVHIAQHADTGVNRFQLRLDPPELGRVDVRMEISAEGKLSAVIAVERPETLDLLQRDSRALERSLMEAGLKTDGNSLSFSLKGGRQDKQHSDGSNPGFNNSGDSPSDDWDSATAPITSRYANRAINIQI